MDRIKWGQNKLIRPEDAWRSYLENPLAPAGLMSLQNHGDETTAALGLLYDYYNAPRKARGTNYTAYDIFTAALTI